jgi:hypothetical protein
MAATSFGRAFKAPALIFQDLHVAHFARGALARAARLVRISID